jgi:DNA-binding MarR family transcriptional regulator
LEGFVLPCSLETFRAAIELFRGQYDEMPAQTIQALLVIAEFPGISVSELGEKLGLAQSSASRNVYALSNDKGKGVPGLDLIVSEINPMNRRQRQLSLSLKGQKFVARLKETLSR